MHRFIAIAIVAAACSSSTPDSTQIVDLPGARNAALKTAAHDHGIPVDWLAAIAFQQGRFEVSEMASDASVAPDPEDPADELTDDTPLDTTGDPSPADDRAANGDDAT